MHFVEAKSHPIFADAPPPKSIENLKFLQRSLAECAKTHGFFTIDAHRRAKSLAECTKTNGFFTIEAHRYIKTHVFLQLFRNASVHLSCKIVLFNVFLHLREDKSRIAHAEPTHSLRIAHA